MKERKRDKAKKVYRADYGDATPEDVAFAMLMYRKDHLEKYPIKQIATRPNKETD